MRRYGLTCAAALAAAAPLLAQEPRLGRISFPTSAGPEAQRWFERGVLYLHSFEYADAARSFRRAQQAEPGFAMAYWGEALSHTHPLWNEQNLDSARAVLARLGPTRQARLARAPTGRERAYLEAVETLYGDGSKPRRDTLYAAALARVVDAYPEDHEARALYALALLGLSQGVRSGGAYMRAAALAGEVFQANPEHPGAAHYLIHAFDDPLHAPLGLPAARAYSRIAPDAAHAQHMTTHIFVAVGMWDEVVSQNRIAADLTAWTPGHYTEWLHYGLLQLGRYREAEALLERVRGNLGPGRPRQAGALAFMRLQHLAATEDWEGAGRRIEAPPPEGSLMASVTRMMAGLHAYRRRDAAGAARERAAAGPAASPVEEPLQDATEAKRLVLRLQLRALERAAQGRHADAAALLTRAAGIEEGQPAEFGPPEVVKPSRELLGEMLLEQRRFAEAQREFVRALMAYPGRTRSLAGLVRAAGGAGDGEAAGQARAQLERNLARSDPGVLELALRDR
jgi:tetratricopeptide (TPR) repeat protein